jgi:hypothetical protein
MALLLPSLNVFGRGSISMSDLERRCGSAFVESGLPLRVIDYYGATGNVAITASDVTEGDIRATLLRAIGKPCAIIVELPRFRGR